MKSPSSNPAVAAALLRYGLAIVFLYAAFSSLQHPLEWVGFLPSFMSKIAPLKTLAYVFAVYELVLTVWLVVGVYLRYAALICALTLAAIVAMNPSQLITTFRDIGLACMAMALFFVS